jgi:hypothetical protein
MKLKSIHILIIILIVGSILFLINTNEKYEKYEDVSNVVVLNSRDTPAISPSAEREICKISDTSNPDYPMCLDVFKISHPRTIYNVNNL